MHYHHAFDLALDVFAELGLHRLRINAAPPVTWHEIDIQAEAFCHRPPERGEVPRLEHQHPVARREEIDQRCLPRSGSGCGKDHDPPGGLEDLF